MRNNLHGPFGRVRNGRLCLFAVLSLLFGFTACSSPSQTAQPPTQLPNQLRNAASPQSTPTYDGSGQITEPSIHFFDSPWNGYHYWLVVQPYPNSDNSKENPSILVSNDGSSWTVPPGLVNPIDLPTFPPSAGHLDDGDLFYDAASDQLWVYYIWEDYNGHPAISHVLRKVSSDGVHWSNSQDLIQVPGVAILSPTVEKIGNSYYMWSANGGTVGCSSTSTTTEYRTSSDGVHWSLPQPLNISQPGYVIWHIEVESVPSKQQYWMLLAAYPTGGQCGVTVLFFANSADGVNWTTYPHLALGIGSGWDNGEIYSSTFVYDPTQDLLSVWYSARGSVPGAPGVSRWHLGFTSGNFTEFLKYLQQ
jgi:hypothetical protein